MIVESEIFNGKDNTVELTLTVDDAVINHTLITRAKLIIGATTLDSSIAPAFFDLSMTDRIIFKLGSAGLTAGRYSVILIIYDANHSNGLVWGELVFIVKN